MKLTNTTEVTTGIGYGSGEIEGNIDFAELKIGDFVIDSQGTHPVLRLSIPHFTDKK